MRSLMTKEQFKVFVCFVFGCHELFSLRPGGGGLLVQDPCSQLFWVNLFYKIDIKNCEEAKIFI